MTDFTTLHNALAQLTSAVTETYTSLLRDANQYREDLIALGEKMEDNRADILEFGKLLSTTATTFIEVDENCQNIAFKISQAMLEGVDACPSCNYEEFVDFCDECGRAITVNEDYDLTGDYYTCATCLAERVARIEE